jgi:hypothetical protein
MISFKEAVEMIAAIDQMARAEGLLRQGGEPNRSEMARLLVRRGMQDWPTGWRPKERSRR